MARATPSFRIGGPAAASLLVNGLLIAALLNLGMGHGARRRDSPVLTVVSLAVLKGTEQGKDEAEASAPPTQPAAADPPPVAPPSPALAPVIPVSIAPPISAIASSLPPTPSIQHTVLVATPSTAPSPPAQPVSGSVSPTTSAARSGVADGLDVKAPPGTSRTYAAKIRSWLYAHKIYPRRARMRRQEGLVQVRFILDRTGMLVEGAIIRGSGNAVLDEEAEAMMRRASPYPPAPSDLRGERIEFTAPIEFVLPV
ncbi:energy transducer TonB [Sphingobium sp. SA2]|uniref:energy transducer TonB n=1 Tax=unclassified Sphingobium TaxID=2611147 RepID=UPI00083D035C|nr:MULTISPECIES: energy transducer TonB [unclassified Sphingobium]AOF94894.1 hypothetical protein BSY17_3138 [Sphingobium sp. RAC03]MDT7532797.1 energy transducer TonB [Sphingobium sp. SA2]